MTERARESFSEATKNWVQVVAFLLAGVWGVYTFVYREIVIPQTAPVNVTTDLAIENVGEVIGSDNARLIAIELTVSANNPSSREVYLLPNYWVAYGIQIGPPADPVQWQEHASERIDARQEADGGRYYAVRHIQLVGGSVVFPDDVLHPGERVSRSTVFYVPADTFDVLEVTTFMPNASDSQGLSVDYTMQDNGIQGRFYEMGADGARVDITEDAEAARRYGLQWAGSVRQLSLGAVPQSGQPRQ